MIKLTVTILLIVISSIAVYSQQAIIKGFITDTAEKKPLSNSVVALLRAKDSTLLKFTRSKADGSFILSNNSAGNYLLLVTHPTYADFFVYS
jgi:hypothetical protein